MTFENWFTWSILAATTAWEDQDQEEEEQEEVEEEEEEENLFSFLRYKRGRAGRETMGDG